MINKLKNNKGSFAIISAILIFIVVLCISAYVDMTNKRWIVNEVQGIMDSSGTNTLKSTVDKDYLFKEILASSPQNPIDKNIKQSDTLKYKKKIIEAYKIELSSQVGLNDTIKDMSISNIQVDFDYDKFGLGKTKKDHPQITLRAVTKMKVDTPLFMDNMNGIDGNIYDSRNNNNFRVEYEGTNDDGQTELVVYSVTRLVYR